MLEDEYESDADRRLMNFIHYLKPSSPVYQYYQQLRGLRATLWISIIRSFESRYHYTTKRARASRQQKGINITTLQWDGTTDAESFREIVSEIKRLASSAQD